MNVPKQLEALLKAAEKDVALHPGPTHLRSPASCVSCREFIERHAARERLNSLANPLARTVLAQHKAIEARQRSVHIRLHVPRRHSMDPRRDTDLRFEECQQEPCPETRAALDLSELGKALQHGDMVE